MPKGHKLVDWSQPGNDTRLLLSIVQTHTLDYGKISAAFGVPKSAITTRMSTIRKKAGGGSLPKPTMSAIRSTPSKSKAVVPKGKQMLNKQSPDESSGSDDTNVLNLRTPSPESETAMMSKTVGGRIIKKLGSPLKAIKTEYSNFDDPHSSEVMKDNSKIDERNSDAADSEDESYDNAKEFMTPGIKAEGRDVCI